MNATGQVDATDGNLRPGETTMTANAFPNADPKNPEHRKSKEEWAKQLRQELAEGGYRTKRHEAADRRQLKIIEKWLKQ
jgi:hypothetical protein